MHLISTLCAGVMGAANGVAEIYVRGTSTRATIYGDFEASTSDSSGGDIALDAYGAAEVYVNQLVDIVVRDEDGNPVREFTDGYASPNIEVISAAFTGQDYVTAASAVSKPTTLQAVLDLWLTNSGAPDWKVTVAGLPVTLRSAFGQLAGLFYNVKSPDYGAVGNGIANDQTAVAAALAAAVAAGGGVVFFPAGTYRITAAISWPNNVSILGVGMDLSILSIDAAAEKVLKFTSANTADTPTIIWGMGFQAAQSNSTTAITLEAAAFVEVNNCSFGRTVNTTGLAIAVSAAARLRCIGCQFNWRSTTIGVFSCSVSGAEALFENCQATALTSATFDGDVFLTRGTTAFRNCAIVCGTQTGTYRMIDVANNTDVLTVTGCSLEGGPGTSTGIDLISAALVIARDNVFDAVTSRYAIASGQLEAGSFLEMVDYVRSAPGATVTVLDDYGSVSYGFTSTVPNITLPTGFFPGRRLRILVANLSGGNWAAFSFTGGSNYTFTGAVIPALNVNDTCYVELEYTDILVANTYRWAVIEAE